MPTSVALREAVKHAASLRFISGDAGDPSKPNYQSQSYRRQLPDLELVRAVYGGTKTMREAGREFLPLHPHELEEDYRRRLNRAVLFNAYKRTVQSLTGMIYRKAPQLVDAPPEFEAQAENVDNAGRDLATFASDLTTAAIRDGHSWLMVDMPTADPTIANRADELAAGRRPYWLQIDKADAINVQYEIQAGRPVLTVFAFEESTSEPDGEFGERERDRVRVLRPGTWELWERMTGDENDSRWQQIAEGTTSLDVIPVVWVPTQRVDHFESEPALLDLAYENVEHYQVRSDHRHALMFASNPMPVFFGLEDLGGIQWGSNRALAIPDPESKAMLLESSGASLESSRQELKDIEARMAALGLQMLVRETRAAETAEAKLLDKSESDSALAKIAAQIENALNEALWLHARYSNAQDLGRIELNDDYRAMEMSPQLLGELRAQVREGMLSLDELWALMQRGELLTDTFDPDLERERIDESLTLPPPMPPRQQGATIGEADDM